MKTNIVVPLGIEPRTLGLASLLHVTMATTIQGFKVPALKVGTYENRTHLLCCSLDYVITILKL